MANFKKMNFLSMIVACVWLMSFLTTVHLAAGSVTNETTNNTYADLQEAINAAQSGDALALKGTFIGSFRILSKSIILKTASGEIDFAILDGGGSGRVLEILGPSNANRAQVSLEGLILQNGFASDASSNGGNGGAILGVFVHLNLKNVQIRDNIASATGGGVAALYSGLGMSDSIVSKNIAATGGGINILNSTSLITHSFIVENSDTQGGGGGILSNGSELTLEDSLIGLNVSASVGGGLYNSTGSTAQIKTIINDLSGIKQNQSAKEGAGIYNSATLTLDQTRVVSNVSASRGGGLYNASSAKIATLNECEISENEASSGGGIYSLSRLILNDTDVTNNSPDNIIEQ